jgi:hypothetical protein
MKHLEMNEMENLQGGNSEAGCGIGCAWLAWAAGVASAELGPVSFAIGAATYAGCCQLK